MLIPLNSPYNTALSLIVFSICSLCLCTGCLRCFQLVAITVYPPYSVCCRVGMTRPVCIESLVSCCIYLRCNRRQPRALCMTLASSWYLIPIDASSQRQASFIPIPLGLLRTKLWSPGPPPSVQHSVITHMPAPE